MPTIEAPAIDTTDKYVLRIRKEVQIKASVAIAWQAMLEEIGPALTKPDGQPMPLKLEAWPGGRYFRDLGNNTGHLWGHVQVIKPPALLEIHGPLFMSCAAISHVQYKLSELNKNMTSLVVTHQAFGQIEPEHRKAETGWEWIIAHIRDRAERR